MRTRSSLHSLHLTSPMRRTSKAMGLLNGFHGFILMLLIVTISIKDVLWLLLVLIVHFWVDGMMFQQISVVVWEGLVCYACLRLVP